MSIADELGKLAALRDQGIITQEEFDTGKQSILSKGGSIRDSDSPSVKLRGHLPWYIQVACVLICLYALGSYFEKHGRSDQASSNDTKNAELLASMPPDQKALLIAIQNARQTYAQGANDMAKGAARPLRARDICSVLPNRNLVAWVGRVKLLSTNGEGKGILAIEIGTDAKMGTWNNSFSDISDKTLIDPGSALFKAASAFKEDQLVRFSGTTFSSASDCIEEASLTLDGSVKSPDFRVHFQSVTPLD